jgi:hypothetical protein
MLTLYPSFVIRDISDKIIFLEFDPFQSNYFPKGIKSSTYGKFLFPLSGNQVLCQPFNIRGEDPSFFYMNLTEEEKINKFTIPGISALISKCKLNKNYQKFFGVKSEYFRSKSTLFIVKIDFNNKIKLLEQKFNTFNSRIEKCEQLSSKWIVLEGGIPNFSLHYRENKNEIYQLKLQTDISAWTRIIGRNDMIVIAANGIFYAQVFEENDNLTYLSIDGWNLSTNSYFNITALRNSFIFDFQCNKKRRMVIKTFIWKEDKIQVDTQSYKINFQSLLKLNSDYFGCCRGETTEVWGRKSGINYSPRITIPYNLSNVSFILLPPSLRIRNKIITFLTEIVPLPLCLLTFTLNFL